MLGLQDYLPSTSTIIGVLVVILVLMATFVFTHWPSHYFKAVGIPGPKPNFLLVDFMHMGMKPVWEYDADTVKTYGKVTGICAVNRKYMVISDVEMLKEIFVKDFDNFSDRPHLPSRGILKHGLFNKNGEGWKQQRHQLSPYFTTGTLKMSTAAINRVLDNLIGLLKEKCDKKEMIEFRNLAQMTTMDMICATAFGVEVDSIANPDMEVLKNARDMNKQFTVGNLWFMLGFIFPVLGKLMDIFGIESVDSTYFQRFTKQLIQQRKNSDQKKYHDFVSILMQDRNESKNKGGLSDDEMIANAILFLVAGYDTTSNTLSFLMYTMATNPEWQDKVFQEIQDNISTNKVTYDDTQKLSCLEMCIEETLRLYPLASRLERCCVKDTKVKGVPIAKGIIVSYPVWYMQRDPEVWENPETFDPERFTPENKKSRNPMYYSPFGIGPRHCIGMRLAQMELKMAVVRILQKFKVVKNSKTQIPLEIDTRSFQYIPKDGVWLSLERREEIDN